MDSIYNTILHEYALINDSTPSIDLFDLNYFNSRIDSLKSVFPQGGNSPFTHTFAGLGAECASISEVLLALSLDFEPSKVIYDSPCKTREDIRIALDTGVVMNLDNEWEMEMVDEALATDGSDLDIDSLSIGLRINPLVGGGNIDILNTSTKASKFGLPLREDTEEKILNLYQKYKWLNGIHIHVGSQGVPLNLFVDATKAELEKSAPELFDNKRRVITEFGRSLALKAGKTLTRVHFIKDWIPEIRPIIQTNVGVNQFVRETYLPKVWTHRITLLDSKGNLKSKQEDQGVTYDIAGPLCFQGDYLKSRVHLPKAEKGDVLVLHDTGAYCMSMYSRYNSIIPSVVYGIEVLPNGELSIECFKEKETPEETLAIWGSKSPRKISLK
ncbi:unnamed protein product [Lepeophtheirus salmonis]|uniref:(salmon louse) hypothetical protein n=1 Tax=Lepeophtheirus salmonis TaxID=72036 RepID=A0A7R8CDR2_LEPSM|nr:unnamed protein product [Lepeophtheirus salmonis]CAF2783293.1 unnamed protein product [Lepeophtheirus salmonis]